MMVQKDQNVKCTWQCAVVLDGIWLCVVWMLLAQQDDLHLVVSISSGGTCKCHLVQVCFVKYILW